MSRFLSVFKDNNDWNEKTIIGAISFAMMVATAVVDVTTGVWGMELQIQEFIYNSFLIITSPYCFGGSIVPNHPHYTTIFCCQFGGLALACACGLAALRP